jgi:hypothetical protein
VAKAPFGAGSVGHACFLSSPEFIPKSHPKGVKKLGFSLKNTPKTGMENTLAGILSTPWQVIPVDCGQVC